MLLDFSPWVETRAAKMTSESEACDLTRSTVTSDRNTISLICITLVDQAVQKPKIAAWRSPRTKHELPFAGLDRDIRERRNHEIGKGADGLRTRTVENTHDERPRSTS